MGAQEQQKTGTTPSGFPLRLNPVPKNSRGTAGVLEKEFDFALTPELATEILSELDPKYLTNFSDWFLVTGILKQHGLKEV